MRLARYWGQRILGEYTYPCGAEQRSIASLLLSHPRINLDVQGNRGRTALHFAACSWDVWLLKKMLAQSRTAANARTHSGDTPLMLACGEKYIGTFRVLLNHPGIDINAKNNKGETALALASKPTPFNPFAGSTPSDEVNPEMVKALESRGARK